MMANSPAGILTSETATSKKYHYNNPKIAVWVVLHVNITFAKSSVRD